MKNIIAFDLGGSGGKLFLGQYDNGKLHLETIHRFEHAAISVNGNLYWDLLKIYQELCTGIKMAVAQSCDEIASLGIDSFCNDFALVTPEGELLTQMHSYRDPRTVTLKSELYNTMSPEALYRINGNQNAPFNTLMQLGAMILQNQEALFQNNKLAFLPDLLIFFLSGKMFTEYTLASVSQMYDYSKRDWNREILNNYRIPQELFAPIVFPGTINCQTNETANRELHTKGFPIVNVCEHDTASAFLSSITSNESALISCGTWALVGIETDTPIINEYGYKYNIANEGGYPGKHHRILKNVMGTWIIQEIRADYITQNILYDFGELETMASEATPFAYLIDVDDDAFYRPGNMIQRIQSYCDHFYGSHPKTPGELIRCINESLAMKYRWNLEKLQMLTGRTLQNINILGGGSQSTLMCQFTANAAGLPVIAGPVEATAFGNMIVQLTALKEISCIEEGRQVIRNSMDFKEYPPENKEIWDIEYQKFTERFQLD